MLVIAFVVLAAVALWPGGRSAERAADGPAGVAGPAVAEAELEPLRAAAGRTPCPVRTVAAAPAGPLAGVTAPCLGEARTVDLGAALAGRPALLSGWASWCGPCRAELPALAEYAARPGAVPVLGVNIRDDPRAALRLLADLHVALPSVTDPDGTVAAALDLPPVLPISYLVRADGSLARVDPPVPFGSADEVAMAVDRLLRR